MTESIHSQQNSIDLRNTSDKDNSVNELKSFDSQIQEFEVSEPNNDYKYDDDENNDQELNLCKTLSIKSINDAIPDKLAGWGLSSVIGCAIFNFNTWGANSAYSLYLQEYLSSNIFPGSNKYDFAIVGGLTFGSGLIMAPLINFLVGKISIKPTILIGIVLNFVGILLASFSTKLWQIYCTQGVLAGIGMAFICVPNVNIIPQWFKGGLGGKRNLAMGISAAGSGLGGIIYNICLEPLLKERTFRWSLRAQAIMCCSLNLISCFLIKSRNQNIKPVYKVYDREVWRNFGCQCLVIWIMFTLFGYVVLMYNLGDFTRSLGYSGQKASLVSTFVAVGIIYGRPTVGKIGDIIGPVNVTICASWFVSLFSLAMWIPCRNFATALVLALFVGSLMGTIWLTMATMNAAIIGLRKFGISMSVCWIACGVFGFASPLIGISLKKDGPISPTQYQPASIFVGLSYFMAGITLCILRGWLIARNSKINDLGDEEELVNTTVGFKETIRSIFSFKFQKI